MAKNEEWYHWKENIEVVNDNAPEEAKISYENYLKQKIEKRDVI